MGVWRSQQNICKLICMSRKNISQFPLCYFYLETKIYACDHVWKRPEIYVIIPVNRFTEYVKIARKALDDMYIKFRTQNNEHYPLMYVLLATRVCVICESVNWVIIGASTGLSPVWQKNITWTYAGNVNQRNFDHVPVTLIKKHMPENFIR